MIEYSGSRAEAARPRRAHRAEARSLLGRLDWVLLGGVTALVGYGLWAIDGITRFDVPGNQSYYLTRQAVFAGVGLVAMVAMMAVEPRLLKRAGPPLFAATVGGMLFLYAFGSAVRGSTRWIDVGFFRFQPSEFGKLFVVLFLAGFLADRSRRIGEWRTVSATVGMAAIPVVLVFTQPDFGTALAYIAALAAVLFVAGTRWSHLAVLIGLAGLVAAALVWILPALGVEVLEDYQTARLTAFANPEEAPAGTTYNVDQSIVAVGSGGLHGRGTQGSSQTNLAYLPEHATDFAFASLAEQRGFVGAGILLALYLLLIWRGIRVIGVAGDAFSAIAAGGIVFALLFQIFINVGMTMGIAPVTGIPLPFVSVGGSSLMANLLAVGVLLSIQIRGRQR